MPAELGTATSVIGTLLGIAQFVGIPAALTAPRLIGRMGRIWALVALPAAMAVSLVPMALIGLQIAYAMNVPAGIVFAQGLVPAEWRGLLSGAYTMSLPAAASSASRVARQGR